VDAIQATRVDASSVRLTPTRASQIIKKVSLLNALDLQAEPVVANTTITGARITPAVRSPWHAKDLS